MGYYATWDGYIKTTKVPSEEVLNEIDNCFGDYSFEDKKCISVYGTAKYYEEDVLGCLESIESITEEGEIQFTGEDTTHWRWIFKDGAWKEESGNVYFDSDVFDMSQKDEFLGRIIDVIQDCIDNPQGDIIKGDWYDKISDELDSIMKAWKVYS